MALGAFGCHNLLNAIDFTDTISRMSRESGMKMHVMTLKADKGFILFQKVVGNGSMRIVTNGAIFNDGGVLENKRTFLVRMTSEAQVIYSFIRLEHPSVASRVGIVTTGAIHLTFFDGMVRRHIGFSPLFLVASITQLGF